jgi:hypothetical protein
MTTRTRHHEVEERFRDLLVGAGLPAPDESAHLTRAVIFIWYDTKAFVLVDLDELPPGDEPFEGFDIDCLAEDLDAAPGYPGTSGYAETA